MRSPGDSRPSGKITFPEREGSRKLALVFLSGSRAIGPLSQVSGQHHKFASVDSVDFSGMVVPIFAEYMCVARGSISVPAAPGTLFSGPFTFSSTLYNT